jgi:hypothetical protein
VKAASAARAGDTNCNVRSRRVNPIAQRFMATLYETAMQSGRGPIIPTCKVYFMSWIYHDDAQL